MVIWNSPRKFQNNIILQDQIVVHVREICGAFSSSQDRGLCSKYADAVARNIEQMSSSYSAKEICYQKCPACAGRMDNNLAESY